MQILKPVSKSGVYKNATEWNTQKIENSNKKPIIEKTTQCFGAMRIQFLNNDCHMHGLYKKYK